MKTFAEQLIRESEDWVAEQLITPEQRSRLVARHPVTEGGGHRFLAVLAMIGGALLVVGLSLVIKSNWQAIPDWAKIGGLVALLLAAYAGGWRLKLDPGKYPKTGDACLMAGAVLFLLGIALVSQIYHLNSRPANGVLLWWLGIVAVPWLTRARGAQFVSVVAGLTWLAMELTAHDSWLRLASAEQWWDDSAFQHFSAAGFLLGVALLGLGAGLRRTTQDYFAGLHEQFGLILMTTSLYLLGFTWSNYHWFRATSAARLEPTLVLIVLAIAGIAFGLWRNGRELRPLVWWAALGIVPVFGHLFGLELGDSGWLWGGLSCLAMFLLNLGMIRRGLEHGREGWINLGMLGIALNVIARYFVLFGTLLEGGVFFIVTGLVVLGLGFWLERRRRALVAEVRKEAAP